MDHDFDVVVIGGGAGGLFSASVANGLGARTCMIEKKRLGGDCTWSGCMPSKALLKSAHVAHLFKESSRFGITVGQDFTVDTSNVMLHVREIVEEISTHHPAEVFEKRGIKVIFGSPRFVAKDTIEVNSVRDSSVSSSGQGISKGSNGKKIRAKKFIICTGSHPVVPPIEGLKDIDYLTNENIFELKKLPQSLIVLGGGPIGAEVSQALNRLGVNVHIVEMLDRILFREDKEVAAVLEERLRGEGVNVITGRKAVRFSRREGLVYVTLENENQDKEEISAENVLVAVGRAPNLEGLSLEKAGIERTKTGVKVNSYLQTTNKDVFACGDVVGPYRFSHVTAYQAAICVRNCLFRRLAWQKVNYSAITWATFTEPEVAHLGLTEEEARKDYREINVYKTEYSNSDRAVTDSEKQGLVKLITDKKGYILGAHIVGARASEIIQGFLIAKTFRIPASKLSQVLFIYPTLSELVKKTAAKQLLRRMNVPWVKLVLKIFRGK